LSFVQSKLTRPEVYSSTLGSLSFSQLVAVHYFPSISFSQSIEVHSKFYSVSFSLSLSFSQFQSKVYSLTLSQFQLISISQSFWVSQFQSDSLSVTFSLSVSITSFHWPLMLIPLVLFSESVHLCCLLQLKSEYSNIQSKYLPE
jgi:hypothetical protein